MKRGPYGRRSGAEQAEPTTGAEQAEQVGTGERRHRSAARRRLAFVARWSFRLAAVYVLGRAYLSSSDWWQGAWTGALVMLIVVYISIHRATKRMARQIEAHRAEQAEQDAIDAAEHEVFMAAEKIMLDDPDVEEMRAIVAMMPDDLRDSLRDRIISYLEDVGLLHG